MPQRSTGRDDEILDVAGLRVEQDAIQASNHAVLVVPYLHAITGGKRPLDRSRIQVAESASVKSVGSHARLNSKASASASASELACFWKKLGG